MNLATVRRALALAMALVVLSTVVAPAGATTAPAAADAADASDAPSLGDAGGFAQAGNNSTAPPAGSPGALDNSTMRDMSTDELVSYAHNLQQMIRQTQDTYRTKIRELQLQINRAQTGNETSMGTAANGTANVSFNGSSAVAIDNATLQDMSKEELIVTINDLQHVQQQTMETYLSRYRALQLQLNRVQNRSASQGTATSTPVPTSTTTTTTATAEPTEETSSPTATPGEGGGDTATPEPTEGNGAGFGVVVSLVALVGAALLAIRREE